MAGGCQRIHQKYACEQSALPVNAHGLAHSANPGDSMPRLALALVLAVTFASVARGDEYDELKVGVQPDGRIVVPTNQILKPAGQQVTFPGRPVDLAWCDDGKTIVVKNMRDLVFLDPTTGKIKQTLKLPTRGDERPGFSIVGLAVRGPRVYATDADSLVRVAVRQEDGVYGWENPIELAPPKVEGKAHGAGLALVGDKELWALSTRGNEVQRLALDNGKVVQRIPVGVAPFTLVLPHPEK